MESWLSYYKSSKTALSELIQTAQFLKTQLEGMDAESESIPQTEIRRAATYYLFEIDYLLDNMNSLASRLESLKTNVDQTSQSTSTEAE